MQPNENQSNFAKKCCITVAKIATFGRELKRI